MRAAVTTAFFAMLVFWCLTAGVNKVRVVNTIAAGGSVPDFIIRDDVPTQNPGLYARPSTEESYITAHNAYNHWILDAVLAGDRSTGMRLYLRCNPQIRWLLVAQRGRNKKELNSFEVKTDKLLHELCKIIRLH